MWIKSKTAVAVAGSNGKEQILLTERNICREVDGFDVLVRIRACGLSGTKQDFFGDILKVADSKSVGTDIAGIVVSVGREVKSFKVGDHVAGIIPLDYQQSGCGEFVRLHEYDLVSIPEGVAFIDAAASVGDSVRAYIGLFCSTRISPSDVILVLNGAAPCSAVCIQLAHNAGAKVLATCFSKDEKLYLESMTDCIDEIIDFSNECNIPEKLYTACMRKTENLGVDIIIDIEDYQNMPEGAERLDSLVGNHVLISCLMVGGRWITTNSGLQLDPPDSKNLLLRSGSLCFVNEQAWLMSGVSQGRYQHILKDVMSKLKDDIIRPYIHHTVGFAQLPEAMNKLVQHNVGKVVLIAE